MAGLKVRNKQLKQSSMKYKLLKLITFFVSPILILALAGCVKSKDATFTDFSKVNDFVILQNSGLANFWGDAYLYVDPYSPDTVTVDLYVGLASRSAASNDITVTLAIDDAKRDQFNADNPWAAYLPFTVDMYKLKDTKIVIKSGANYGHTELEIYTLQVDFSQSWMLPVSITDASGKPLTSNMNTMYFHVY